MEAEARLGVAGEVIPMGARRLEQGEGADEVTVDEIIGAVDGAVDMRLGGPSGGFDPA